VTIFLPEPVIDYVFVENVVWGHLLLEARLHDRPAEVAGNVFCISNEEPRHTSQEFYDAVAYFYEKRFGRSLGFSYLPPRLMLLIAHIVEGIQRITHRRLHGDIALLTPAMFDLASLSYAFSSAKAGKLLGYKPLYNLDQAIQKTIQLWDEAGKP